MPEPDQPSPELHGLDPGELLARGMHTVRLSGGMHDWTPPTPEELARLLPQYHIESMIGHGGMGAVYKGFQEKLGRPVAIKLLPAELTADAQFVTRFEREARTLAKLQHPGIVAIYDFGQTSDGHLYFVMEYVEGTDLRRVLQGPGLNPEQALEIIAQVCEALHAAHRQGVIHRDIKPANILLTTDGRVKLADFGLARPDRDENEGITLSNVILGTPDYMAPEQRAGQPDHRADIFALGLMLYEMLTGRLPRGAWVPPSRKVQVDVRIDEVVIKALQEEPDLRYQQASEMKTDVDHIRTTVVEAPQVPPSPVGTLPQFVPPPAEPRRTIPWAMIFALLALAAVAAFWFFEKRGSSGPQPPAPPVARETSDAPLLAVEETVAKADTPAPAPPPTASPAEEQPSETVAEAPPDSSPQATQAAPSTLDEALFDYGWQYKTTRPAYSFQHGLIFEKDGTAFSCGRTSQWKWSWTATGPRTVHFDQQFKGYTADVTFDPTFTKFTGQSTDGSTLEGFRTPPFPKEDIQKIRQQFGFTPGEDPAEEKTPPAAVTTVGVPEAEPPAPVASAADPVVGHWEWKKGGRILTLHADGRATDWRWGRWICVTPDATPRTYQLIWPDIIDTLTLVNNGAALEGQNQFGQKFHLTRLDSDPGAQAPGPALSPAPAPRDIRQALLGYVWSWNSPVKKTQIRFMGDGTARLSDGSSGTWTITGGRNVRFVFSSTGDCTLVFDESFASFEGRNHAKRWKLWGNRLERAGSETPGPAAIVSAPAAPPAAPAPAVALVPKNAAEALVAFRWKFDSPANKGDLTFVPGGEVNKTWKEAFPWRWEALHERTFRLREMGGKRRSTVLAFNADFTAFGGPGYTAGQTYRGERLPSAAAPAAPPAPSVAANESDPSQNQSAPSAAASAKSYIDMLVESGPAITDQVLSALDAPSIPEATVSLWAEDILDEAAKRPVEFQPAYQQASVLVAAWKAALRERYQILGTAKYSGMVMDGPDMQGSRKTVLHMWDWLQYARERDDAAKHEKKLERTADFFASGPPKRWADRSTVLRAGIEKIYAGFRKARREALAKASEPAATP